MRTRSVAEVRSDGDWRWFAPALERLESLRRSDDPRLEALLRGEGTLRVARAPGRLDVMGGIADYSGSLVLELPLARSTYVLLRARTDDRVEVASLRDGALHFAETSVPELTAGVLGQAEGMAAELERRGARWAAYPLGVVQLCLRLAQPTPTPRGMSLLILSDVPEGSGVSSSAALEVATMSAVASHLGVEVQGEELAAACQWVENHVVGAPCGIMDQLTSVCGRMDRLLRIRCQPAHVEGTLEVPPGWRLFGIDSGERHAVSGDAYTSVRTAAFMGYRLIAAAAGLPPRVDVSGRVVVDDPRWRGFLANLTPAEFDGDFAELLPERMRGADFLARFESHLDPVTRVRPEVQYPVRQATRHPVMENARVERFAELLPALDRSPEIAGELGELMYASHASYSACGLGSRGTDRLVELVRDAGASAGMFGAKITGGGSGGTVAILGRAEAEDAVREIAGRYGREAGVQAEVFGESGPGAAVTGVMVVPGGA